MEFDSIEHVPLASGAGLRIVGVGGGGGNALQHMIDSALRGVNFICANTDVQSLTRNGASSKIQLGERLTKGLGAGANPSIGREAALESLPAIKECLSGADMVFVTAGMGGGTGTGAAPVIAQAARELGALTVGVVTKPFSFEGAKKKAAAESGIAELRQHVDCLITIPNDRLLTFAPKKALFADMLRKANDILYCAVKGISDVIMIPGLMNVDFADVRTAMNEAGLALMGTGTASGENRARDAAMRAITSPLLDDMSIDGAKAVLYNITASMELTIDEVQEIGTIIADAVHPEANIIFGAVYDENVGDELSITVIATGIEAVSKPGTVQSTDAGRVTHFSSAGKNLPPSTQVQHAQQANGAPTTGGLHRGRRADLWADEKSDLPANIRKEQALDHPNARHYALGEEAPPYPTSITTGRLKKAHNYAPGKEDFIYDEEEFEMPSFIRRQAD